MSITVHRTSRPILVQMDDGHHYLIDEYDPALIEAAFIHIVQCSGMKHRGDLVKLLVAVISDMESEDDNV